MNLETDIRFDRAMTALSDDTALQALCCLDGSPSVLCYEIGDQAWYFTRSLGALVFTMPLPVHAFLLDAGLVSRKPTASCVRLTELGSQLVACYRVRSELACA